MESSLRKFVKVDSPTANRQKLQFARVMIEVNIDQEFPDQLSFINENGVEVVIEVSYEWKPVRCSVVRNWVMQQMCVIKELRCKFER